MGYKEFQLLMLFWNLGLVDTFNVIKLCVNCGSQYMGIVLSSAAGNTSELGIKSALEPILGFGTSYQFVRTAATAVERRQRIATLASFLAASGGALTTDPTTNAAMGAAVASKIAYMKAILTRGGSQEIVEYVLIPSLKNFAITANTGKTSLVTPLLSPAQIEFQANCKRITQNIVREHTARRYINGLGKPTAYLAPIASTQINTTATTIVIGWTSLGVGVVGLTILGALYLFQRAERKRWQNQNNKIVIDVTASPSD